jgi:hypothetical protein
VRYPFGHWVFIDRLPEEPIIAFVYLDPRAGPSAKGGLASERELASMPSRTVRLSDQTALRELTDEEIRVRALPAWPSWVEQYGRQPDPEAAWLRRLARDSRGLRRSARTAEASRPSRESTISRISHLGRGFPNRRAIRRGWTLPPIDE